MKTLSTSIERVDALMNLSDKIYPIIDREVDGQTRARRMLRLGIAATGEALRMRTARSAGDRLHSILVGELTSGGLPIDDETYDAFPSYRDVVNELPKILTISSYDEVLDHLASKYADVQRATVSQDGTLESDASHAIHLSALALPYAAEYHPQLEQGKIASYCFIHDFVEAYAGDTPSLGISEEAHDEKHRVEQIALGMLKRELGTRHRRLYQVVLDYENLADDEACYVKTFDKLDPSFTHIYSSGRQLVDLLGISSAQNFLTAIDQTTRRMQSYSGDFPDLLRDRDELTQRVVNRVDWPA